MSIIYIIIIIIIIISIISIFVYVYTFLIIVQLKVCIIVVTVSLVLVIFFFYRAWRSAYFTAFWMTRCAVKLFTYDQCSKQTFFVIITSPQYMHKIQANGDIMMVTTRAVMP